MRFLSKPLGNAQEQKRNWLPMAALISGTSVALAWVAADVFIFDPGYWIVPSDALEDLPAVLLIGTFVGVVTAIGLAISASISK
ncbi:hypothetical protein [Bythopirellula polymerisocia]|uniref:Uncharacterized protein n=1 Tax=Bythopirellula polymerisocia TaxID=2528003 RepID=A0A5C6CS45_9BACT|nr:hypothetical protein [Bythopirellula polymerisocia]TWU25896.1 hypothetical protein Pla144_31100 [Bythopirellula polymerisocia]